MDYYWIKNHGYRQIKVIYRREPVPGIHRHKPRRYWRHPKTTQERRINIFYLFEGGKIRGKRRPNRLPTVYDDQYISNLGMRSWKRTKKRKQWM